ncbi:TPA: hypothetical protein ACPUI0_000835 [Klebsiella pneumoniae]
MTITLQAVNDLIASLESAGELSIREQKFLKLARAFKQLAAENMALKQFPEQIVQFIGGLGTSEIGSDTKEKIGLAASRIKTPATDRIVAEAEARGVEKGIAHLEKKFRNIGVQIMNLQWLADSLRKGASE